MAATTPTTPTTEPATLVAGDTAKWQRTLADYSAADGWVLTYTLANSAQRYTFSATASGADHLVTVAAATTTNWAAGTYAWRAQVAKSGEVFTVGTGTLQIDAAWSAATDTRTHAATVVDMIEAYLENRSNIAAAQYQIAGRDLRRYPLPELLALRDRYRAELAREQAAANVANGLGDRRRIFVRFGA